MPYRINLETIRNQYGTDNQVLKQKITDSCQSSFESLDDDFEEEDGWKAAKSIMEDYLNGTLQDLEGNSAKDWYIIEILIEGFGQLMNNGSWYPADINCMYGFDEFRMFYLGNFDKLKLKNPDDFPVVFTIQKENFAAALANIKMNYASSSQVSEFESWINEATEHDQDIVLYYY